jgi:hypothetical protein
MTRTDSDRGDVMPRAAVVVACSLLCATTAIAQSSVQPVTLRIGPPVGETMRMRLDQRVEMTGTTRAGDGDSTTTVVTTLMVISRTFVERRDRDATVLLAATDSVAASSSGADSLVVARETRRALQGKRVRLRIAPDGATEIVDGDGSGNTELNAIFSQMPATLPSTPVAVGQSWSRTMVAPVGSEAAKAGGKLQATFRLDSLGRNGELAYVSFAGTLTRAPSSKDGWSTLSMSGSMNGGLVVDRRLGWISDARMSYMVRSTMAPSSGNTPQAVRFRMKVTQWVRAVP